MKARVILAATLAVLVGIGLAGLALAGSPRSQTAVASQATARFHDLDKARAAGYTFELPDVYRETCIVDLAAPSAGAMGVHMVNLGLLDDTTLDPAAPEVLVYERRNNGTLKLVGLEYVVFKAAWEAEHGFGAAAPILFGVPFESNSGARYGLPPFYALHAWIWKPNPSGLLQPWNPNVSCP